jgi:hypothetical protein
MINKQYVESSTWTVIGTTKSANTEHARTVFSYQRRPVQLFVPATHHSSHDIIFLKKGSRVFNRYRFKQNLRHIQKVIALQ